MLSLGIDIDDTTLNMITKIYLQSLDGGRDLAVDTHTFGRERPNLGVTGDYARYTVNLESHGSYRDFRDNGVDHPEDSPFVRDLRMAIAETGGVPKGPLFDLLKLVLSEESLLNFIKKITTRGHQRSSIHYGFKIVQDLGELQNIPYEAHIDPVSSDALGGSTRLISERKLAIELADLEKIARLKVSANGVILRSPDGLSRARYHVHEFWDDDLKTAPLARQVFGAWMREHPQIPMKIIYRRPHRTGVESIVFQPDGTSRLMMSDEYGELPKLVEHFRRLRLAGRPLPCLEVLTKRQGLPIESYQTDVSILHKIR